eukprot:SAG22_NODE_552_length_9177_cov_15.661489_2_plen_336_part_00
MERVRAAVPATAGSVAAYIPQLAKADPESFGAALCSVDGKEFHSAGDDRIRFSIQSCVKPFTYLMACDELGLRTVHDYVGREPSGQAFNSFDLTDDDPPLPFNPMINSGAITVCNMLGQHYGSDCLDVGFSKIQQSLSAIATDDGMVDAHCGYDHDVFKSEAATGHNNYAIAHFLRARHDTTRQLSPAVSPETVDENLALYFKACSVTVDVRAAAVLAATLAAGGTSPFSQQQRFDRRHVNSAVQLMFSCGMYNASGAWACQVGLPAKSGVAGCIMVVVPNVLGLAVLAPPLDKMGNSVRSIALIESVRQRMALPFPTASSCDFVTVSPTSARCR